MNFLAEFDRVSHRRLLCMLRSIRVGRQFLSIVSEVLSDRMQCVCLDGKIRASVNVVLGTPQNRVLGRLLFILFTSELFPIVWNHILGYADYTTIYAVIHRPLSRPQVIKSLNQDFAAINSWCLKWYMRLDPKKIKFMVVGRCQTIDLPLSGAELEELNSLRILPVTLDSK